MAISSVKQILNLSLVSNPISTGSTWITGNTKTARKIGEQNLPADFLLTEIQVQCLSLIGADGNNPCIIRVFQYGRESSAAMIEIPSIGDFIQTINLPILARYGAERKVIVDAWDPDTASPNNTCSIRGIVSVAGRPFYSTGGAQLISAE